MLALLFLAMLDCGDLCRPQAFDWYASLLEEGGFGRLETERAAFLIREGDGTMTLEPWGNGEFRRASFRGAIPRGTIALIHTHPAGDPRPSSRDRAEARRLRLPVVVITPASVIAAQPDGRDRKLSDGRWSAR